MDLWLFHLTGQLNSTTTIISLPILKERGEENMMKKGLRAVIRTGGLLTNYCQNERIH